MSDKGALPKTSGLLSKCKSPDSAAISGSSSSEYKNCINICSKEASEETGFELQPKPKVMNIPQETGKDESLNKIDSSRLRNSEDVNVVYKSNQMQDSSLSVLFVGSASTLTATNKDDD